MCIGGRMAATGWAAGTACLVKGDDDKNGWIEAQVRTRGVEILFFAAALCGGCFVCFVFFLSLVSFDVFQLASPCGS